MATWVERHPLNNSLLLFIHGIFGDAASTWRGIPDLLQNYFTSDSRIRSYDSCLFEYQSKLLNQPPLEPTILNALDSFLKGLPPKYHTTVLVAHSQGGLLAKLYVLRELERNMGQSMTIDMIITLGTPHKGRWALVPLLWTQHFPLLGNRLPFWQLAQLASRSCNIRSLRKNWTTERIQTSSCAPTPNSRYIRSVAISGAYDLLVSERSAAGMTGVDIHRRVQKGHIAMAKPRSHADRVVELLYEELSRHEEPKEILEHLSNATSNAANRSAFVRSHTVQVVEIVQKKHPDFNEGEVANKAAALLLDFIYDFPKRPLRKLTLESAIQEYCERQLG